MANLIRWDPFREISSMRDSMDNLFNEGLSRSLTSAFWDGASTPAMDVYSTEDEVIVKLAVPGVRPEDIQVSVSNGVLVVRGEVKEEKEETEKTYHLRERRYGSFVRSVALPISANADKATAEFDNGVITLTLPKAEEAKTKTINIKVKKA
jgi:HSP20 family protein